MEETEKKDLDHVAKEDRLGDTTEEVRLMDTGHQGENRKDLIFNLQPWITCKARLSVLLTVNIKLYSCN